MIESVKPLLRELDDPHSSTLSVALSPSAVELAILRNIKKVLKDLNKMTTEFAQIPLRLN